MLYLFCKPVVWFVHLQLKTLQHELGCKVGMLKAKNLELEVSLTIILMFSCEQCRLHRMVSKINPGFFLGEREKENVPKD